MHLRRMTRMIHFDRKTSLTRARFAGRHANSFFKESRVFPLFVLCRGGAGKLHSFCLLLAVKRILAVVL